MTTFEEVCQALSDGLDLCVRARRMDAEFAAAGMAQTFGEGAAEAIFPGTRCLTPALWLQEQYDRDLADWEAKSRALLLQLPPSPTPRGTDAG